MLEAAKDPPEWWRSVSWLKEADRGLNLGEQGQQVAKYDS
jgi:hypothetical protein